MPRISSPLLALAFALACGGGGNTNPDGPPICYQEVPLPDSGMVRPIRNSEWAHLVLRGYTSGQRVSQDCTGHSIDWNRTDRECDVHEPDDEHAPEALEVTDESVIVGRSDQVSRKPIWIITHRFENGDGFGPVMLTERTAQGVEVRATGVLRLPTERARLRLRTTGGQEILVAEGERCPHPANENQGDGSGDDAPPADPNAQPEEAPEPFCLRATAFMPRVGDRFMSSELRRPPNMRIEDEPLTDEEERARARRPDESVEDEDATPASPTPEQQERIRHRNEDHCIGPAFVYTQREAVIPLAGGWQRRFKLVASMEYQGQAIIVHEQVVAEDFDPRDPGRPARPFRTTDADRVIWLQPRGGMLTNGIPLFERTIRANGSTQLPIAQTAHHSGQSGSGSGGH